jgi:hypothetical protein
MDNSGPGGAGDMPGGQKGQQQMDKTMGFFKDQANALRSPADASKLGLEEEEYLKRKAEASKGYKVKKDKGTISVQSTAFSKQTVTKGTATKILKSRRNEVRKKYSVFNKVRWTVFFVCAACFSGLVYEVMYPILLLHYGRYERMRRRHEEVFLPAMKKLEEQRAQEALDGPNKDEMESADQVFSNPPTPL